MINALGNIAAYIPVGRDHAVLYDFISKMLEMYVNIGLEAKKLSDKTGLLKATNSAGNLGTIAKLGCIHLLFCCSFIVKILNLAQAYPSR